MRLAICEDRRQGRAFIADHHYSRKCAPVSYMYALFDEENRMHGVVTFGQPASPYVAISIRGKDSNIPVIELNRLAIADAKPNDASRLIGFALRSLPQNILVVSYADTGFGHIGYVYQATNWHYAGLTKARTDIYSPSGHARHHCGDRTKRQNRSAKYRYWIATGRKALKASLWSSMPYPKGKTTRWPERLADEAGGKQ